MPSCHFVEVGEIYTCEICGLTLEVTNPCRQFHTPPELCETCEGQYQLTLVCCGQNLKKM